MPTNPSENRQWWIYKITSPSGRIYIGVTSNIKKRQRMYAANDCKNQSVLFKSFKKYGFNHHFFEIIDEFTAGATFAFGKEIFWIRSYMSFAKQFPLQRGMNMTRGGDGNLGLVHSAASKEKMSQRLKGRKDSEETRLKKSIARKGVKINRIYTEADRRRLSAQARGRKHTDDAKRKIGEASKGNQYGKGYIKTSDHIEAIRAAMIGNKYGKGPTEKNKESIR